MNLKILSIMAVAAVASFAAVVTMALDSDNASAVQNLNYDDYISVSGPVSCSGSMELVNIDNSYYVHAKSIGPGSFSGKSVNVVKADLYVYLIFGQSNGGYSNRANPAAVDVLVSPGNIYYYGDSTAPPYGPESYTPDTVTYGMFDMMDSPTQAHIGGLDQPFAAQINHETGKKVYVINCCIGGSKAWTWRPGSTSYTWAQTLVSDAMAAIDTTAYNIRSGGLIWTQGESSPDYSIELYKGILQDLLDVLQGTSSTYSRFIDGYSWDKMVISLVRQYRGVNSCCAQIEAAQTIDNIYLGCIICDQFSVENGLLLSDNTHYTQRGLNIDAHYLADKFIEVSL